MGFINPTPPPFEYEEWKQRPHLERIKVLAQDWALNGFGTPDLRLPALHRQARRLRRRRAAADLGDDCRAGRAWRPRRLVDRADRLPEGGDLDDALGGARPRRRLAAADPALLADDRRRPLLAAAGHDAAAALARAGAADPRHAAHALRRRPLRGADRRRALPAALRRDRCDRRRPPGASTRSRSASSSPSSALLGLRDKVPFLAARAEIYGNLAIIFLFPLTNMIVAAQLVFVCIWWGAASSKLNRHFPFVVTVMISNTPWNRWRAAKRRLYRDHPEDLRPSSIGCARRPPGHGDRVHPAADPARLPGRRRSARSPSPGW